MKKIFFFSAILLLSCKKKDNSNQKLIKTETSTIQQELSKEVFKTFFLKFSNDSVFQKTRIKDTITFHSLIDTDKFEITKYLKDDISFMDFRKDSIAYKKEYDKYRTEIDISKDSTNYSLYGIDNGILTHYVFKRNENENDNWYLNAIHDYSY
ncbi:hypothetical protein AB832_06745 [Flavobacteriaceae bacterium (ex Bugula neritina AB1)]|nr:hypothetical protein AB832_06745 [Flavobacteriaceae bacterium (ex Bugula neritina AB1)]